MNRGAAVGFCTFLSDLPSEKSAGRSYRLPTEAEWEFACRAGSTTHWYCGSDEKDFGNYEWYDANSGEATKPIGRKKPNPFGLYDMHGNVSEWCADWFEWFDPKVGDRLIVDPQGPASAELGVIKGGNVGFGANSMQSGRRSNYPPSDRHANHGFRIVMELGQAATSEISQ
jgi:formylglycine-generating enzyme required for sulfatase activity